MPPSRTGWTKKDILKRMEDFTDDDVILVAIYPENASRLSSIVPKYHPMEFMTYPPTAYWPLGTIVID